jgi:hypothetical protein
MTMDDPWRDPPPQPQQQQQSGQPSVSNKVGCLLGAGGCFGFVVLFCLVGFGIAAVGERFNKLDQKVDKIEKQLEDTKPAEKKDDKKPDDKKPDK